MDAELLAVYFHDAPRDRDERSESPALPRHRSIDSKHDAVAFVGRLALDPKDPRNQRGDGRFADPVELREVHDHAPGFPFDHLFVESVETPLEVSIFILR